MNSLTISLRIPWADHVRAKSLSSAGFLITFQQVIEHLTVLSQEAGVVHSKLGDSRQLASSLYLQGYTAWAIGDFTAARARAEEGLVVARASDEVTLLAALLVLLGQIAFNIAFNEGEAWRACVLMEEGFILQQASGDTRGLSTLIRVLFACKETNQARLRNEERLTLSLELGSRWGIADSLTIQGYLALQRETRRPHKNSSRRAWPYCRKSTITGQSPLACKVSE